MVRRLSIYLVLALALAGFFVLQRRTRETATVVAASATPPLSALIEERDAKSSHLSPDARFLDAVGDVAAVLGGGAPARAAASWNGAGWTIRCTGREVGRLSEYPSFAEARALLMAWAGALGARESLATAPAPPRTTAAIETQIAALHAMRAADLADRAWAAGHHDPATARLGARALAWLAAECFDQAGAGEAIPARALAWSAIAGALDSTALASETALLADVMGYPAEACALAGRLEAPDPVRLYVRRDDEVLDAMASRGGAPRSARWLSVRRCVQRNDLEAWTVASDRGLGDDTLLVLPVLSSALALGRFETDVAAGATLLTAVADDLRLNDVMPAPIAAVEDRDLGQAMEMFETLLEAMPESADGAFLDRVVLRGWYRAAFYSSLYGIGEHLREDLSDVGATRDFARAMGDGSHGPEAAAEFQRWFAHLADLKANATVRANLKNDMIGMPHFGAAPRLKTWTAMTEHTNFGDPFVGQCAKYLEKRLDTRPESRIAWANVQQDELVHLKTAEAVWAAAIPATHPRDLAWRGWWAGYRGDRATLDRLLGDPGFADADRARLIHTLRFMTPEDSLRLDALSENIIGDHPDDWGLIRPYLVSLAKRHRNDRIRTIARAWLTRPDRSQRAFDDIDARNHLAQACLEEGRIEEGYEAIRSVVASWQGTAMALGAELLDRKGEGAAAETLAMMTWQRYPDDDPSQALAIAMWWRHGKFDVAAHALAEAPQKLTTDGWRRDLGRRFVEFERERPRDARKAVDAMVGVGLADWNNLGGLAAALREAGRGDAAAEISAKIRPSGAGDKFETILEYRNVKTARGAEAAAEWLRTHLPDRDPRTLTYLHLAAFQLGADDALWLLPMPNEKPEIVESLWLARVAAVARDTFGTAEQVAGLRTHFAVPGAMTYRHYARMLLGQEPVDSVLALPLDNRSESEAYYYIGLRCQSQGDVAAAAAWYERCLDVNVWSNAEHHWARNQLVAWANRARSLERIAGEARRAAPVAVATTPS